MTVQLKEYYGGMVLQPDVAGLSEWFRLAKASSKT